MLTRRDVFRLILGGAAEVYLTGRLSALVSRPAQAAIPASPRSGTLPLVQRNILHWESGRLTDVARATEMGVNVVHVWPCPPGRFNAPPVAIREVMAARLRAELDALHAAGLKVIASTGSTGFDPAVMQEYGLDPERYYARDARGVRQLMLGGNFGTHIYTSCYNNPQWTDLHREMALLLAEQGFDGIWYDVGGYADPAVLYCQCEHCKRLWRAHLARLHRDQSVPLPTAQTGANMKTWVNREHLRWRWRCWERTWSAVQQPVRRRYPRVVFSHNLGVGANTSHPVSVYLHAHTRLYDYVHWEEWGHGCAPYSTVCSYLLGRAAGKGKPVVLVQNDQPARSGAQHRVFLAEGYAAGGAPQNWMSHPEVNKRFFHFVRQHEDCYANTTSMASVAIAYSWWSKALYEGARNPAYWMGQMLLDRHVAFDFVVAERDLNRSGLSRYKTLILPDVACLTAGQIRGIQAFLARGSAVIATGLTGLYDFRLRPRRPSGLAAITGGRLSLEECPLVNPGFEQPAAATGPPPSGWDSMPGSGGVVVNPLLAYGWPAPEASRVWHVPEGANARIVQDTDVPLTSRTQYRLSVDVLRLSPGSGGALTLHAWQDVTGKRTRSELARLDLSSLPVGSFHRASVAWDAGDAVPASQRVGVGVSLRGGFADNCRLTTFRGGPAPVRLHIGAGRLVYFPNCPEEDYWVRNPRDFARSASLRPPEALDPVVADALDWAFGDTLPMAVRARSSTVVLPYTQAGRLLVHLINYHVYPDGKQLMPEEGIRVEVVVPRGRTVTGVSLISPDAEGRLSLPRWREEGGRLHVVVDRVECYAVLVASLARAGRRGPAPRL